VLKTEESGRNHIGSRSEGPKMFQILRMRNTGENRPCSLVIGHDWWSGDEVRYRIQRRTSQFSFKFFSEIGAHTKNAVMAPNERIGSLFCRFSIWNKNAYDNYYILCLFTAPKLLARVEASIYIYIYITITVGGSTKLPVRQTRNWQSICVNK
jgi:hypothetical protein